MRKKTGIISYSILLLAFILALAGCSGTSSEKSASTGTGALDVYVTPGNASVVVEGPGSFSDSFVGNKLVNDLTPGTYTVTASLTGYGDSVGQISVVSGQTVKIVMLLLSLEIYDPYKGNLNFNVNPPSASVKVTGPEGFEDNFIGNKLFTGLTPGIYTAQASAPGFADGQASINVIGGLTSNMLLMLRPSQIIIDAPRAVYRDGTGNLVEITTEDVMAGKLVFYAWMEDKPEEGINPEILDPEYEGEATNPGVPTENERREFARNFTQNLVAGWVGFKDNSNEVEVIRPVIGADVRWEIDQFWSWRWNSMQFGTSDDNRVALGYGVMDDQADTRTNNARLENQNFPSPFLDYPLYNVTGIGSPYVDGFTWVTLFSPDRWAAGRIVAVATINGEEIGKQILYKNFKPKPEIEIEKTVDQQTVNMVDGQAMVNWTVTVRNVGNGCAENVYLNDYLASGDTEAYEPGNLPPGSTPFDDGFDYNFPLCGNFPSEGPYETIPYDEGCNTRTFHFTGTVTEPGIYCNFAQITAYNDWFEWWNPIGLNAQACFTAVEAKLSIFKDFVDFEDENTSLGQSLEVTKNTVAKLRVRVINNGDGPATDTMVNDILSSGVMDNYEVLSVSQGTLNGQDGFDAELGELAPGASVTIIFTVKGTVDGKYCDTATVSATSGEIIQEQDTACLTVATPELWIEKWNRDRKVTPGESYTSTIKVGNSGNATAENVSIYDLLGYNSDGSEWVIYVSSNFEGNSGVLADHTVTTPYTVSIPVGEHVYFYVVSRIPLGGAPGRYCDTATATASNAETVQDDACVCVKAFAAIQTQLVDSGDPVNAGNNVTYSSVLYNEILSNEGVDENEMRYSFGVNGVIWIGWPGWFLLEETAIYADPIPIVDPITGLVLSGPSNPTAVLLTEGVDYTLDNGTDGRQDIVFDPTWSLNPGTAVYLTHLNTIPGYVQPYETYTTGFIWDMEGTYSNDGYTTIEFEPTTVLPGIDGDDDDDDLN